jgi:hypothetical protein
VRGCETPRKIKIAPDPENQKPETLNQKPRLIHTTRWGKTGSEQMLFLTAIADPRNTSIHAQLSTTDPRFGIAFRGAGFRIATL